MKHSVISPAAAIFFSLTPMLYAGIESRPSGAAQYRVPSRRRCGMEGRRLAGNNFIETPHIDRLATGGIRPPAYASTPNCAPTRACLMSASSQRHGVFTVVDPRHDPGQPSHRIMSR